LSDYDKTMAVSLFTPRRTIYGWIPDLPDHRDKLYEQLAPIVEVEKLPGSVDLRPKCTPIQNQGELGSCTANALAGNVDFLKKQKLHKVLDFSRLFIYYNERVIEHTVNTDSGAMLRDGIKTLAKAGVCPESEWPYASEDFTKKPSQKAYTDALQYQITAYYRLTTLDQMKHTLASGYPFVFGFSVYESFESEEVAKTGIVPLPGKDERLLGGHAVMAAGYDEGNKQFIMRNSCGTAWGIEGYFMMPYEYLITSTLASDFWTIRDMK
jgi:C1A family cysteine protease